MSAWLDSIKEGFTIYTNLAPLIFLPLGFVAMVKGNKINFIRFAMIQAFFLYMNVMFALVFLPLPTMEQAASLTWKYQLIPFYFIASLIKDPCVSGVLGVLFNLMMTIPFGMFLRYYCGFDAKKVLIFAFALTSFIELGQLTGLFFTYPGSYRLFDVDDLIQNTCGAYIGFRMVCAVESFLPELSHFDLSVLPNRRGEYQVQ